MCMEVFGKIDVGAVAEPYPAYSAGGLLAAALVRLSWNQR